MSSGPENVTNPTAVSLRRFERPSAARASWQVLNSVVPYLGTMAAMYLMLRHGWPWWTTLPLAIPAAGFMVRVFILMHDCTHSSFLPWRRAERVLGRVLGVLTFTPFGHWRHSHLGHHATSGDLDRRGVGDVWTLTVDEYRVAPRVVRWQYRLVRDPLLMLLFGPFLVFLVGNRIPPRDAPRERVMSVWYTNAALAALVTAAALTIGLRDYLLVQLPVLFLGGVWGIWLFYVQHQFEPSYWERGGEWSPLRAALQGSSYYRLPKVLQWFSGNIGLHHVHHLRPRIPNYHLQRCLDATPELRAVPPLTLRGSLRCGRLALWDVDAHAFVTFRDAARAARVSADQVAPRASTSASEPFRHGPPRPHGRKRGGAGDCLVRGAPRVMATRNGTDADPGEGGPIMSFSDTFKKNVPAHVDTPAQAEARAQAAADVKAKADAKAARAAAGRAGAPKGAPAAGQAPGGTAKRG